jgi:hypothetical protein
MGAIKWQTAFVRLWHNALQSFASRYCIGCAAWRPLTLQVGHVGRCGFSGSPIARTLGRAKEHVVDYGERKLASDFLV